AEDGIRDFHVTGVQTCALPILGWDRLRTWFELATFRSSLRSPGELDYLTNGYSAHAPSPLWLLVVLAVVAALLLSGRVRGELARSEERRVGKGCKCGGCVSDER